MASMTTDRQVREHVLYLLRGGGAHLDFDRAFADVPMELRGAKVGGSPHTLWRLLEHMRMAQWDIVEFTRNAQHVSPEFPAGYWPIGDKPPSPEAWDHALAAFRADVISMQQLVNDPALDLFAPISHGDGQTLLREALLLADHNAYHLGQVVMLRRAIGAWMWD